MTVPAHRLAGDAAEAFRQLLVDLRKLVERHADTKTLLLSIKRAERFVEDLSACGGRSQLNPVTVSVLPLLCSFADLMRHALGQRFWVEVDVERDCPECLADPQALEDALTRLAANARDAMPNGGPLLLRARAETSPEGQPCVAIEMSDRGSGMSDAVLARAVEPFFSTKATDHLAGMGLAAVAGFARQSGGELRLSSHPGRGTSAVLRLPAT